MELCQSKKHIAIFSSLNYHYHMFGYIIQFCSVNNYKLTIFTDNVNNNGWFDYYKKVFSSFEFEYWKLAELIVIIKTGLFWALNKALNIYIIDRF